MTAVNATQEGPPLGVSVPEPAASIGRRVGAYVIDAVIAGLIGSVTVVGTVMLWMPLLTSLGTGRASGGSVQLSVPGLVLMFGGALLSLAWAIVWALMQGGRGSIGMRLLKIRLIQRGLGTRIGFWRALGRMIVFGFLAGFVVGYFTPLFDRSGRRQGWHDLMVGAVVIDAPAYDDALARAAALAAAPPEPTGPPPIEELNRDRAFGLPVARPTVPPLPGARGVGAGVAPAGAGLPTPPPPVRQAPPAAAPPAAAPPAAAEPAPGAWAPPAAVPTLPAPTGAVPTDSAPTGALIADLPAHLAPRSAAAPHVPQGAAPQAPQTPEPQLELRWDDGTVIVVPQGAVLGRDPVASAEAARVSPKLNGALSLPVADESRSLSKTHFGVGIDRGGAWIVDLHSTNGSVLHREGIAQRALVPGELTGVLTGDIAVFGTRQVTFRVIE